jgi:predicted aldo/keto reductase-like oxidoreductase
MTIKCQHCGKWTKSPSFWEITHNCDACEYCGESPEDVDVVALMADKIEELEQEVRILINHLDCAGIGH